MTSETITCHRGPRVASRCLRALGLRRDSWTATTSNREITAARQATACQSRLGESLGPATHFPVRSPSARMFHVPIRRFESVLAGMAASSAARNRSRSSVTAAGRSLMPPAKQTDRLARRDTPKQLESAVREVRQPTFGPYQRPVSGHVSVRGFLCARRAYPSAEIPFSSFPAFVIIPAAVTAAPIHRSVVGMFEMPFVPDVELAQ